MMVGRRGLVGAFFFFSSRRRHTRSKRDWSSDVCFPISLLVSAREASDWHLKPPVTRVEALRDRYRGGAAARGVDYWAASERLEALHAQRAVLFERRSEERRVGEECRCRWWLGWLKAESA